LPPFHQELTLPHLVALTPIEVLSQLPSRISLEMFETLVLLEELAGFICRKEILLEQKRAWDQEVEQAVGDRLRDEAEYERTKRCGKIV